MAAREFGESHSARTGSHDSNTGAPTEGMNRLRMEETTIRECTTIEEFDGCVSLQREAFGLPDLELSPRRHLIVSRQAGGWTLGAFVADRMVGFVHHLAAVRGDNEIFGYSHVMAVAKDYQNKGVGARLKWAQRERALGEGRKLSSGPGIRCRRATHISISTVLADCRYVR